MRKSGSPVIAAWGTLALGIVMDAAGVFLIRLVVRDLGAGLDFDAFVDLVSRVLTSPLAILGGILFALSPLAMAHGLSRLDLSLAYPVKVGGTFVCIAALSALVLAEPVTWARALGVGLIALGVWVIVEPGAETTG